MTIVKLTEWDVKIREQKNSSTKFRLVSLLGVKNMFCDSNGNVMNEFDSIDDIIKAISKFEKDQIENLQIDIITFKGYPITEENIQQLISLWIKKENITLFSWGVGIDNFKTNSVKIDNMPFYSRRNTALMTIKMIDFFLEDFTPENAIIIWRWNIWSVISQNYDGVKQISSIDAKLLEIIKEKRYIVITTSLTENNKHFVNNSFLEQLDSNAVIINASRKEHVDEKAVSEKNIWYLSDVYEWELNWTSSNFENCYYINKKWQIVRKIWEKEEILTKEEFLADKNNWLVKYFFTPHFFWRWWSSIENKWRKFYMYRKLLGSKEKSTESILKDIIKLEDKTILDFIVL